MSKYPDIAVQLTGQDGNAFSIIGKVLRAMRHANIPDEEMNKFRTEATSGDYNNLIATCMEWVNVK